MRPFHISLIDRLGLSSRPWFRIAFLNLGLVILLVVSLQDMVKSLSSQLLRISIAYPLTIPETQPVYAGLRVAGGLPLYVSYSTPPIVPLSYGALQYYVPGMISRMLNISDPETALLIGRMQSFISGLMIATILAWMAFVRGVPAWLATFTVLPLFWIGGIAASGGKFTPDLPAAALSLVGWALLTNKPASVDSKSRRMLFVGAAVFVWTAKFHYKPTVILGEVGWFVEACWIAGTLRFRAGRQQLLVTITVIAMYVLSVVISSIVVNLVTNGLWRKHMIDAMIICPFEPRQLSFNLLRAGSTRYIMYLMLAWALIYSWRSPLYLASVICCALEAAASRKLGSGLWYFIGSVLLWSLAFMLQVWRTFEVREYLRSSHLRVTLSSGSHARPLGIGFSGLRGGNILLAMLVFLHISMPRQRWNTTDDFIVPSAVELRKVEQLIRSHKKTEVLVLEPFVALRMKMPLIYADPVHVALLLEHNLAEMTTITSAIISQKYEVIVAPIYYKYGGKYRVPAPLGISIAAHYKLTYCGKRLCVYEPKRTG